MKNKGGRPPRPLANGDRPGVQSRGSCSVRLLNSMREKLLADAEARGTSLSGQIEYIIQQWYDQPALIDALADRLEARRAAIFADRHPKQTYGVRMYDSSEINAG